MSDFAHELDHDIHNVMDLDGACRYGRAGWNFRILHQLFLDQDGVCHWCEKLMELRQDEENRPDRATIEHIKPKSLGGRNNLYNMRAACLDCNSRRGNGKDRGTNG